MVRSLYIQTLIREVDFPPSCKGLDSGFKWSLIENIHVVSPFNRRSDNSYFKFNNFSFLFF